MAMIQLLINGIGNLHISAKIIISAIVLIFFISLIFIILLKAKYAKLQKDIDSNAHESTFNSMLLNEITEDFKAAWVGQTNEVNTQAIIENHFNRRLKMMQVGERLIKNTVSIMIVLGLLGTFIGLFLSVQSLVLLFQEHSASELLQSVESGLVAALVGMSTAFSTSLVGIAGSVILTFLNVLMSVEQSKEKLMVSIEEYLDNVVSKTMLSRTGNEYEALNNVLRQTFIEFGEKIAERFDKSLLAMHDDVRNIAEVNEHLRNTIEIMDVCFIKITDAIKASTQQIDENFQVVNGLTGTLNEMHHAMNAERKVSMEHAVHMTDKVADAADLMKELTERMRRETEHRNSSAETYNASLERMADCAKRIQDAVGAIPEQMFVYSETAAREVLSQIKQDEEDLPGWMKRSES